MQAGAAVPLWNDTGQTIQSLSDALNAFDWKRAQAICAGLISALDNAAEPYPVKPAVKILALLRRKRRFDLMEAVADAMIRGGQSAPQVQRQYAQALIDQGKFVPARSLLHAVLADAGSPDSEKAEAGGLLGRIDKQLYVNGTDPSSPRRQANLRQAVAHYYDVYKTDPKTYLWHGINSVALLARAKREGVAVEGYPAAEAIASDMDAILQQADDLVYWDRATAVEVAVALGDWKTAYDHALYYVADPQADAFEIGSLLRQLTEVWQLSNDSEPGSTLLPTLKAALLKREGGCLDVPRGTAAAEANTAQAAGQRLEKVFGTDRYQPLKWYKTGLKRGEAVARIESLNGKHLGTGFLVKAADFFPGRGPQELMLLTNAHVISPADQPFPGALPPQAAVAVFEASDKSFNVAEVAWSSPPEELDATFVTLEGLDAGAELCPLEPEPAAFQRDPPQRVYVIGYPLGGGLSFSLQDSVWLDTDGMLLHYRTPTEPGSSGSPVFDQDYWTLVALHHAGEKDLPRLHGEPGGYEANEGIAIGAIRQATRAAAAETASSPINSQEKQNG